MIVYVIHNLANGKIYVGKTSRSLQHRWARHAGSARFGKASALHAAIRKYGAASFSMEVLVVVATEAEANVLERLWIAALGANVRGIGYNLTAGGEGISGFKFPESAIEKLRHIARTNHPMRGHRHSEESKAKMRAAKLGYSQKAEHVAKRVRANTGQERSAEQRARARAAQMRPEVLAKTSVAWTKRRDRSTFEAVQ